MILKTEWMAGKGEVWYCPRCGKMAKYKAGFTPGFPCSRGWDESCFLNAELVDEKTIPFEMRLPK